VDDPAQADVKAIPHPIGRSTAMPISQNHAACTGERRHHPHGQIDLPSKQQNTKMLQVLERP